MACNHGDSDMEDSDTDCNLKPPPRHRSGKTKSDDELLSKLEEQNSYRMMKRRRRVLRTRSLPRILSSDTKTVTTIPDTPSKRLSACGEIISLDDSNVDTPENYEEICEESDLYVQWGQVIGSWNDVFRRKPKNVKNLVRKGIPNALRGMVWQLLSGARDSPLKEKYPLLIKTNSACERMIKRDIARTFPDHSFFKDKDGIGQGTLFNVVKAYSVYDKEVGYCQGSAFIVGILLMQMPEEEAFCVFVKLMQEEYRMREIFKPTMTELGLCIFQLESLLQEQLPELHSHFQAQGFHTAMYASSWFLTLFAAVFPLNASFRVMDIFISEGREGLLRIIIALLTMGNDDILQLDMEGLLKYFQKDMPDRHEKDMDSLIQTAAQVKISTKKLKKLEKEYTRAKHKEAEDNEEIRRQRTENRLLMQRVEHLEKESAALADRLIQGQVTLAEQQEEMFVLKRDLVISRRHDAETSAALLEANRRIEELTMFKNHIVSELAGRKDNTPPSESDLQRIALEAEVEEHKIRESRLEQQVNKLSKRVQELENELYLLREEVTPRYPQVTFTGAQCEEEQSKASNETEEKEQNRI